MKKEISQIRLYADRARKDKLDQQESTKLLTFLVRSDILASAYLDDLRKSDKLVSDEEIAKYYNEHKDKFEEVRARHILISTQAPPPAPPGKDDKDKKEAPKALSKEEAKKKAQSILDRIRKGEDFAKLAEENSDDPGSKTKGGDLDYFPKGAMVPQFDQAAFSLPVGQVSDLVETQFGYHIIKVEDHRTKGLDDQDTKKQIADELKQDKIQERIKEITDKSNVQVAEDFNITVKPEDLQASPPPQLPQPSPAPAPQNEKGEKPAPGKNAKPSTDKKK
jgi:parvulin-like peptidyl-prolyl isomerase